jgi:hypothetical protein
VLAGLAAATGPASPQVRVDAIIVPCAQAFGLAGEVATLWPLDDGGTARVNISPAHHARLGLVIDQLGEPAGIPGQSADHLERATPDQAMRHPRRNSPPVTVPTTVLVAVV